MAFNGLIILPSLLKKLKEAGYENMEQLIARKSTDLKAELNLDYCEVKQLIDACDQEKGIIKRPIVSDLKAEIEYSFTTSSKKLDNMLLHGIPPTKITEICGESGSGKTQICMQLAINVQLPQTLGGAGGECIYIDTEGSFLTSRYTEMAKKYDVESMLKGLHFFRVLDHTELIALIRQMHDIVKTYPNVKLIAIDSLAYHFRLNVLDSKSRGAILEFVVRTLLEIAKKYLIAIVVTNHVTQAGDDAAWTPSLGGVWTYWLYNRIFLYRKRQFHYAYLYKAAGNVQDKPVQFCIKDEGIGDPEEEELELEKTDSEVQQEMDDKIDASLVELKAQHVKGQQDEEDPARVDDFWDEAFLAKEFLSQLPPNVHQIKKEEQQGTIRSIPDPIMENEGEESAENYEGQEQQGQLETDDDHEFILGSQVEEMPFIPLGGEAPYGQQHGDLIFNEMFSSSSRENDLDEGTATANSNTFVGQGKSQKANCVITSYSPLPNANNIHDCISNISGEMFEQASANSIISDGEICIQVCPVTIKTCDEHERDSIQPLGRAPLLHTDSISTSQRHQLNSYSTSSLTLNSSSNEFGKKRGRDTGTNDTLDKNQVKMLKTNKETTDQADWDSDLEEELDNAFLDEINSPF